MTYAVYVKTGTMTRRKAQTLIFERVAVVDAATVGMALVAAKRAPDRSQYLAAKPAALWCAALWPETRHLPPMILNVPVLPAGTTASLAAALDNYRAMIVR